MVGHAPRPPASAWWNSLGSLALETARGSSAPGAPGLPLRAQGIASQGALTGGFGPLPLSVQKNGNAVGARRAAVGDFGWVYPPLAAASARGSLQHPAAGTREICVLADFPRASRFALMPRFPKGLSSREPPRPAAVFNKNAHLRASRIHQRCTHRPPAAQAVGQEPLARNCVIPPGAWRVSLAPCGCQRQGARVAGRPLPALALQTITSFRSAG